MTALEAVDRIRKELGMAKRCASCRHYTSYGCKISNFPAVCSVLCSIEADENVRRLKSRYRKERIK